MTRILIVDDHAIVRQGLERLLGGRTGLEVVGTAAGGEEGVAACRTLNPDVVLMDLEMPGRIDGIEATRQINDAMPATAVLVLTSFSDRPRILKALDAGAVGYMLKDAAADELERGIHAAARGESPLHSKVARTLVEGRRQREDDGFSDREREVLGLIVEGMSNKRIALRLGITERTVKGHLTNIFRRLGVDDRTQAALWAQRHGFGPTGTMARPGRARL